MRLALLCLCSPLLLGLLFAQAIGLDRIVFEDGQRARQVADFIILIGVFDDDGLVAFGQPAHRRGDLAERSADAARQ